MADSAVAALGAWHDFYVIVGTAAASLIGAMFVVVSIGAGFLTAERATESRIFLTPTVAHLSIVLFSCALTVVPTLSSLAFATLFGLLGASGIGYSGLVAFHVGRRNVELIDRVWYALAPVLGYALMIAAAAAAARHRAFCLPTLGAGMALILAAGIRNAWDLILYFVTRAGP